MRPAPVKLFALTLALGGVVTILTGRRESAPDTAAPPDSPWAEAPGGPSTSVLEFVYARNRLARDVAAGRRSLRQAAGLVRDLRRRYPGMPRLSLEARDWSRHLPAGTEEERLYLEVIWCVRVVDGDPPDAARLEAVTARLEGEFWEARCAHGAIELPEVPPAAVEALLEQARAAERAVRRGGAAWLRSADSRAPRAE
jgi:hypothetical protein